MRSESPEKKLNLEEQLLLTIKQQDIQQYKLFYSLTEKQSDLGIFDNKRLLILNTKDKTLGYCDYDQKIKKKIPFASFQDVPNKKKVNYQGIQYSRNLYKMNSIVIKCYNPIKNGKNLQKQESWIFSFKSGALSEEWKKLLKVYQSNKQQIKQVIQNKQAKQLKQTNITPQVVVNPILPHENSGMNQLSANKQNELQKNQEAIKSINVSQNNGNIPSHNNQNINMGQKSPIQQFNHSKLNEKEFVSKENNSINSYNNNAYMNNPYRSKQQINSNTYNPNQLTIEKNSQLGYSRDVKNTQKYIQKSISKQQFNKSDNMVSDNITHENINNQTNQIKQHSLKRKPINFLDKYNDQNQNQFSRKIEFTKKEKIIDWNNLFYESNKKVEELQNFCQRAQTIVTEIIEQISINQKIHKPLRLLQQQLIFQIDLIHIRIAFSSQIDKFNKNIQKEYRNEFRNYDYFLKCIKNNIFKVPLCCLIDYKGILAICKAIIHNSEQVPAKQFTNQLNKLERITKIKKQVFYNKQNMIFRQIKNKNTEFVYLDNLKNFLPVDKSKSQLSQHFMQSCNLILSGQSNNQDKSHEIENIIKKNSEILLSKFQSFDQVILNPKDLKKCLYKYGLNRKCLHLLYKNCEFHFLKKYFITEIVGKSLKKLIKEELHLKLKQLANENQLKKIQINSVLAEIVIDIMKDVLTQTQNTQKVWKQLLYQIKKIYNINATSQQINKVYLFQLIIQKISIQIDHEYFQNIKKQFFKSQIQLDYSLINKFKPKLRTYPFDHYQQLAEIEYIIDRPAQEIGFTKILEILNLRQQKIPQYFGQLSLGQSTYIYLANFIPYDQVSQSIQQYKHLEIYNKINDYFPDYISIQLAIMAIKWVIKRKQEEIAMQIFQNISEKISFWGGQFHPLMSQIYDYFSFYNLSKGDYDQAITLAKSSLTNIIKLVGNNNLLTAQKHYQLGNIFFKIEKKEEAINHYLKTKQILANNKKTKQFQYGIILLKLSQLYLNLGKINEVETYAQQCLKIFGTQKQYELQLTETYQVLARAYQITQQKDQSHHNALNCGKQLNSTQDPKIFQKMFKIAIYPSLIDFTETSRKSMINIIENLQIRKNSKNHEQSFIYIRKRAQSQIISEVFLKYLKKIEKISREINNKDLMKKYKRMNDQKKSQSQDFLALIDHISHLIDESFMIGVLFESEC